MGVVAKSRKCIKCWYTREYSDVSLPTTRIESREDIVVLYMSGIVPIVSTQCILDIDDVIVCFEIIAKKSSSSKDNRPFLLTEIYPGLRSTSFGEMLRYDPNFRRIPKSS